VVLAGRRLGAIDEVVPAGAADQRAAACQHYVVAVAAKVADGEEAVAGGEFAPLGKAREGAGHRRGTVVGDDDESLRRAAARVEAVDQCDRERRVAKADGAAGVEPVVVAARALAADLRHEDATRGKGDGAGAENAGARAPRREGAAG